MTIETGSFVSEQGFDDSKSPPSPSAIANLRDKLARALSGSPKTSTPPPKQERSVSRGRDYVSTGRGGAGNFVRSESASRGRVTREQDGDERGRELSPTTNSGRVTHTGRGGAGNVRSPSREPGAIREEILQERQVIDASKDPNEAVAFSTGRGGLGNIKVSPNTSVSRERNGNRSVSRDPPAGKRYTSSGRGGRGNIHHETSHTQHELEKLEEDERIAAGGADAGKLHSTGRGGAGNLTTANDSSEPHPTAEVPAENGVHSTGKGGYGNITESERLSASSTEEAGRGRSNAKHPNGIGEIWDKVTHGFKH